jgi:hypothetical protein
VYFNCVQRCQGFVTAMVSGCGPVVKTSHLRADVGPRITK